MDERIKELEKSHTIFRNDIIKDIDNFNNKTSKLTINDIKTKVMSSDFCKKLSDYLRQLNCEVEVEDFDIKTTYKDNIYGEWSVRIPIIHLRGDGKLLIVPFGRIWGGLLKVNKPIE